LTIPYTSATINFNFYITSAVLADTMAISLEKKTGTSNTQVSCISILTKGFGVGLVYQTFLDGYLFHFTDEAKNASTNLIEAALGVCTL